MPSNDSLPTVIKDFPCGKPYEVTQNSDEDLVRAVTLKRMSFGFDKLGDAWKEAKSIDEICKLNLVMFKMSKDLLDVCRVKYGTDSSGKNKTFIAEPLE